MKLSTQLIVVRLSMRLVRVTYCYRSVYRIGLGCGRAGPSLGAASEMSPNPAPFFPGFVTPLEALRLLWRIALPQGQLKSAKSKLSQCCGSNGGRRAPAHPLSRCYFTETTARPRAPQPPSRTLGYR